jgi:hypothetical protein
MTAATIYAPQKKYAEKQRAAGLIPVTVWVPEADRERTLEFAEKRRNEHKTV